MNKPIWDKHYSVASPSYSHILFVDISEFFDCPSGISNAQCSLNHDNEMIAVFFKGWQDEGYNPNAPGHVITIPGRYEWFIKCRQEAVEHVGAYERWVKSRGVTS